MYRENHVTRHKMALEFIKKRIIRLITRKIKINELMT